MKKTSRILIVGLVLSMCVQMLGICVSATPVEDTGKSLYYYEDFDGITVGTQYNRDYKWPVGWFFGKYVNASGEEKDNGGWYQGEFGVGTDVENGSYVKLSKGSTSATAVQARMQMYTDNQYMMDNFDWKAFTGKLVFSYDFKLPEQIQDADLTLFDRPALNYTYEKDGTATTITIAEMPSIMVKKKSGNFNNGVYLGLQQGGSDNSTRSYVDNQGNETIAAFDSVSKLIAPSTYYQIPSDMLGKFINIETVIDKADDGSYVVRSYMNGSVIFNYCCESLGAYSFPMYFAAYKISKDPMADVANDSYTPKGFSGFYSPTQGSTSGYLKAPALDNISVGIDNIKLSKYGTTSLATNISIDETANIAEIPIYNSLVQGNDEASRGFLVARRPEIANKNITIGTVKKYSGYSGSPTVVAEHGITVDLTSLDSVKLVLSEDIKNSLSSGDRYEIEIKNLFDIIGSRMAEYWQTSTGWGLVKVGQDFTNSTVVISGKDWDSTYKKADFKSWESGAPVVTSYPDRYHKINTLVITTRDETDESAEYKVVNAADGTALELGAITYDDGTGGADWNVKGKYTIPLNWNTCFVAGNTYKVMKNNKILTTISVDEKLADLFIDDVKVDGNKKPTARFKNTGKLPVTYRFIAASYDENKILTDVQLIDYELKSGEIRRETLSKSVDGDSCRLLVWDTAFKPLNEKIE